MRKLSQTEELAKILASRARHHLLTPEQVSRAMEDRDRNNFYGQILKIY